MIVLLNTHLQSSCNAPMITHYVHLFVACSIRASQISPLQPLATWLTGKKLELLEPSEATSDACSNSFMPWLVLSVINK